MRTLDPIFTAGAFSLDSFLFQKRRFLRAGFSWDWSYFCDRAILTDLSFEMEERPGDFASLPLPVRLDR